mgnify:CR=1 FL=1
MYKYILIALFAMLAMSSCISCESGKEVKVEKKEVKKERVLTIHYYWMGGGEQYNMNGYIASTLHDAVRGPFRIATKKLSEAVNGRIRFVEVSDILSADMTLCATNVNPSILAFWDKRNSMLAINMNASGGNLMQTMMHEIGHSLSLPHSGDPNSFMYWSAHGGIGSPMITDEDVKNMMRIIEGN